MHFDRAEGLNVHHGRDVILADTAREFADAVIMLMSDGKLRRRYERAAAELVAQYDWPVVGEKFSHALQEAVRRDSDSVAKETLGKHGA